MDKKENFEELLAKAKKARERRDIVRRVAFKEFLVRAKKATYAGEGSEVEPSRKGSHDLVYSEGPFTYHDSYVGSKGFGGQEIVYYNDTPVWAMSYYGVEYDGFNPSVLRTALSNITADDRTPVRGPRTFRHKGRWYRCNTNGELDEFSGYEYISGGGTRIQFMCHYAGGVIED